MTTAKQQFKKSMSEYRKSLRTVSIEKFRSLRSANGFLNSFIKERTDRPVSIKVWLKLDDMGKTPAALNRIYC